jgi:hypothetical protein
MIIRLLKSTFAKTTKTTSTIEIALDPSPSVVADPPSGQSDDVIRGDGPSLLPVRQERRM